MDRTTRVKLIYYIMISALVFGFPLFISGVWAYLEKEKGGGDIEQTHFARQVLVSAGAVGLWLLGYVYFSATSGDTGNSVFVPWFVVAISVWIGLKKLKMSQPMGEMEISAGGGETVKATIPAGDEPAPTVSATSEVKASTFAGVVSAKDKLDSVLAEYLPTIKAKLKTQLGDKAKNMSDANYEKGLGLVYKLLPLPFRLVMKKDKFIAYGKKHRETLLAD